MYDSGFLSPRRASPPSGCMVEFSSFPEETSGSLGRSHVENTARGSEASCTARCGSRQVNPEPRDSGWPASLVPAQKQSRTCWEAHSRGSPAVRPSLPSGSARQPRVGEERTEPSLGVRCPKPLLPGWGLLVPWESSGNGDASARWLLLPPAHGAANRTAGAQISPRMA